MSSGSREAKETPLIILAGIQSPVWLLPSRLDGLTPRVKGEGNLIEISGIILHWLIGNPPDGVIGPKENEKIMDS